MTLRLIFFCLSLLLLAPSAQADTNYAAPDLENIAHTLVRFNVIDLSDDVLIDDYAMLTDCGLYTHFFRDDFKWNDVRKAIRESVRINIATFPTTYHYDTSVQLDRYDFKYKDFRFKERATIKGVNSFILYEDTSYACDKHSPVFIPMIFRGILDQPVTIEGLPIGAEDAQALLHRMDEAKNTDHVIYVRFHLRVVNINPLQSINKFDGKPHYTQDPKLMNDQIKMDMRLDGVNFYEDRDMTRLLYSYRI